MQPSNAEPFSRRVDLDWIRIVAFASLILYHVGMYYVTWDWHVKSPFASGTLEPLMLLMNPWRLALLFLVSGAATAFIAARLAPGKLARSRSIRLLVPLVFGMLVIVPPQSYFEVVEKLGYADGFGAFYARYLGADHSFCRGKDCLILPTWNHLWFVAYLWAYTMAIVLVLRLAPAARERSVRFLARALTGWGVLLWPWFVLAVVRIFLVGRFPSTHDLVNDWYNHALYFTVFAIGFLVACTGEVWASMERIRWFALLAAVASYGFIAWYFFFRADVAATPDWLRQVQRAIYAMNQWSAIVAACGFAHRHIHKDGPVRAYLTDAIFPFYIVHQTAIIVFAVALRPRGLQPLVEAPLLIALVAITCVASYEIVRRLRLLRPLFGLKPPSPQLA
jgi:glucan biosynthesis protein C